jgi:hypothetical protein
MFDSLVWAEFNRLPTALTTNTLPRQRRGSAFGCCYLELVGFFRYHDHGIARFAGFTRSTLRARRAWFAFFTGWAWDWHRYRNCRARGGNRHFHGRGDDGRWRVDGGFFASAQSGDGQQCCQQGGHFHSGFLFSKCREPGAGRPDSDVSHAHATIARTIPEYVCSNSQSVRQRTLPRD